MRWLCHASALATAMAVAPAALAQQQTHAFDIPSQSLSSALLTFGRQANLSLAAPADITTSHVSPAVQGQMTVKDALERLLAGSGLIYEIVNGSTVRIYAADQAIRTPAGGERRGQDRVIVTGTNIRGVYPESSPVDVYTAEDIARTGAVTTEQFIQKLPQNMASRSSYASNAVGTGDRLNHDAVAGVELRGAGYATTLVLMNGRRLGLSDYGRTADVSLIPTSAIARVEVLTDGASAIYGSDAIGGVVNFVLRDDFDGAESKVTYGGVDSGGLRHGSFSQVFGRSWRSGHGLISYDYQSASALDISDRSYALAAGRGHLTPVDQRQNLLATFSQEIGERLTLGGDIALAQRDTKSGIAATNSANPASHSLTTVRSDTEQVFSNLALDYRFSERLSGTLRATYSEVDIDSTHVVQRYNANPPIVVAPQVRKKTHSVLDLTGVLDGALMTLPAGEVRFSVGAGVLSEDYDGWNPSARPIRGTLGRRTSYAFGELLVPVVSRAQKVPFVHRLELSLAGRYTKYTDRSDPALNRDFGDGADPKVGVLWAPTDSLNLRSTYGTSFRAPSLVQLDETSASNDVFVGQPVPFPNGPLATLLRAYSYAVPELGPENAETYTIGFDYRPQARPTLRLSGTYYSISYTDRIALAPTGGIAYAQTPELYPDVIFRPPSAAYIEQILATTANLINQSSIDLSDPAAASAALFDLPNIWVLDARPKNLAISEQDGFDVTASDQFETPWGTVRVGGNATRILAFRQQASRGSPVVSVVDQVARPVDLRARAYAGLSRGGFDGTLSVSYVDDYSNPFATSGSRDVESWTTLDLSLSYQFGSRGAGVLDDVRLSLSVQNLLDEAPPFVERDLSAQALFQPVGFDPTNANPLGRFLTLGLAKKW